MLARIRRWRAKEGLQRTAGEESVFGEDCYGVHEQYRDWKGGLLAFAASAPSLVGWGTGCLPWNRPPKEKNRVAMLQQKAKEYCKFPKYFAVLLVKPG